MSNKSILSILEHFASAVQAGDAPRMCTVLTDRARWMQGCGDPQREDINPQIQLAIDSVRDLKVVSSSEDSAVVAFPHWLAKHRGEWHRPEQTLEMRRVNGEWVISNFNYGPA